MSREALRQNGVGIPAFVSDSASRYSDDASALDHHVNLSFHRNCKAVYRAFNRAGGRLQIWPVKLEVLLLPGVLFTRGYANTTGIPLESISSLLDLDLSGFMDDYSRSAWWQVLISDNVLNEYLEAVEAWRPPSYG